MPSEPGDTISTASSLLHLEVAWAPGRIWLGPAWAVVCGSLASPDWKLSGEILLTMITSLFLVDGLLGSVWHQVSLLASEREDSGQEKKAKPRRPDRLPYFQPGSWGYRLWGWMGAMWLAWWGTGNPTSQFRARLIIAFLLVLVLGAFLSPVVLILLAVSLLVAWWWFIGREKFEWLPAIYRGGLPWLIGYMSLSNISGSLLDLEQLAKFAGPIFWAAVYLAVVFAFRRIAPGKPSDGARTLILAQLIGILALVLAKQPILAGVSGILLLPQLLFLGNLPRQKKGLWYLQRVQIFTMASMLVGAFAL